MRFKRIMFEVFVIQQDPSSYFENACPVSKFEILILKVHDP